MTLYAVVVTGVSPKQCVVVWDRHNSAELLSDHLNERIGNYTTVEEVDSFFPDGMTDADPTWLEATDQYLKGAYHNTTI